MVPASVISVNSTSGAKAEKGGSFLLHFLLKDLVTDKETGSNSSKTPAISVHTTPTSAAAQGIPVSEEPRDLQMPTQKTTQD